MLGLRDCHLFEIWNSSTDCNNLGAGGFKSTDQCWDGLSVAGQRWHGIASDDAHDFQGEFYGYKSLPGQAWVVVRAAALTQANILEALERGDFYSTTGITLDSLEVAGRTVKLEIRGEHHYKYSTGTERFNALVIRYRVIPYYVLRGVFNTTCTCTWEYSEYCIFHYIIIYGVYIQEVIDEVVFKKLYQVYIVYIV